MNKKEKNETKNENETKKFEDLETWEVHADMSRIIKDIALIVGVYYKLEFKTEYMLDIQLYDDESRIWLETNLKGIKGMLYSFNIDLIDDEALKYFNALQIALFKENIKVDGLTVQFKYEISNRHRKNG